MAGNYAKIWTNIYNDEWFLSLSAIQRSIWIQLIITAKIHGDTGLVSGRSWSALGSLWGCDGKTTRKVVRKFFMDEKTLLKENSSGVIVIEIVKYYYWQRLRKPNDKEKSLIEVKDGGEKSGKNPPIRREEKRREENNKSDDDFQIKDFVDLYHQYLPFGRKVLKITGVRKTHIQTRIREHPDKQFWIDLFAKIKESKFLRGEIPPRDGYKQFQVSIDFIINENRIVDILEGKYPKNVSPSAAVWQPGQPTMEQW